MTPPLSIKTKLTGLYLLIIALLLAVFGGIAYFSLANVLYAKVIYPWDTRLAHLERTADGTTNITSISSLLPDRVNYPPKASVILTRKLSQDEISRSQGPLSVPTSLGAVDIDIAQLIPPGSMEGKELVLSLYISSGDPGSYELLVVQQPAGDAAL